MINVSQTDFIGIQELASVLKSRQTNLKITRPNKKIQITLEVAEYEGDVGDTNAILKLVTKSQPEIPCFRLLAEANFKTFGVDATTASPKQDNMNQEQSYGQVKYFTTQYSTKRKLTNIEIITIVTQKRLTPNHFLCKFWKFTITLQTAKCQLPSQKQIPKYFELKQNSFT